MKIFYSLLLVTAVITGFYSCQKEPAPDYPVAQGTLKANNNDCLGFTVNGIYKKDLALNASNYIDVSVRFVTTGNYNIYTDTINGISFKASGNMADTGISTIRLAGYGTPQTAGISNYTIRFNNSSCTLPISITQSTGATAVFSLGNAGGNCTGVIVNGNYSAGTAMTPQNYIRIDVSVSLPGTYLISTNTQNGISFSGSGNFNVPGSQQVLLYATGTATSAGTFNFAVLPGVSQCLFPINFSAASTAAVFTTTGNPNQCNPITINGTYKAGVALNAGNNINIQVNVTSPGTYSISTAPSVNGMVFNGAGNFTSTGLKNVTLYGIGTPLDTGTHSFTIAGPSGCKFDVNTQSNGGVATGIITCKIDGVFTSFNIDANAMTVFPTPSWGQAIEIRGNVSVTGTEKISLDINRTQANTFIVPGTYGQGGLPATIAQFYYYTPTAQFWYGISTVNPVTIVITSISNNNVKGTFYGRVYEGGGWGPGFKTITEGSFDVPVN